MPPLGGFFAKLGVLGAILSDSANGINNILPGILIL
jgi:NADH:ubiquinone oxidoreductase subunit 2 (subunit N)